MLLASPISLLFAVFGSSAAPLLFLLIKSQTDTQEDTPITIKTMAFMTLMGTFPIMFLILESVVKLKEQKIFLVFRRLGMRDSCFWFSVSIQVFLISLISSILGALSWKYFINAVQEIDGRVMLLILFLQNFISGSLMQFWGSFTATSFSSSGIFMMTIMQSLYGFNKAYETVPSGVVILLKQFGFPMTNFGYVWYAILEKTAQFQDGALVDVKNSFGFSELQDTLANGLAPSLLLTITFEMAIFYMFLSLYLSLTVEYQGFSITSNMFFSSKYWNPEVQGISSNTIETNQVTKRYLHNFTAVKSMTQRFEKGNIYGIVGKNGAGKSTLISMLTGMSKATSGNITVCGFELPLQASQVRNIVGLCPQQDVLFPNMTPLEHVQIYLVLKQVKLSGSIREYALELLKKVQLDTVIDKNAKYFSGGMKRRLSFILSTIGDIKVLILDEPTTGLDILSRSLVWKEMQALKKTSIVILTTHDMEEAELLADKILMMDKGKVVAEGSSLSLKTQYGYEQKLVVTIKDDLKSTYSNKDVGKWLLSSIPLSMALPNFQDNITICFPKKVLNFATKLLLKIEQDQILDWHLDSVGLEEVFMGLEEIGSKITKQKIPDFEKFVVNHLVESEEEFEMVEKPEEVKVEVKKDQLMCLKVEEPKETKEVKSVKVLDLTEKVVYYNMSFKMNIIVQLRKFYFLAYASISPILGFATCFYLYCLYCDWTGQEAFLTYYNCLALCLCIPLTSMIGLLLDPRAEGVVDLERYHGATVSNYYIAYAAFSMASSFVFNMFYVGQMITRLVNLPTEEFLDMEVYGISAFGTACMSIFYANVFRDSNAYLFIWILNIMFATIPFSNPLLAIIPQIAVQQMLKNYNDPEFDKILCLVLPLIGGSVLAATGILIDLITSNYFFEHSVFKISQTAEELQKSTDVDEGVKKEAYEVNELENEDDLARLHQLSKVYGTQKSVDKINLSFKENETFAMLGPNGAGKSTLFKLLQGQLKPSSGNFELFSTVSVCNQENVLYEFLTARQQLEYFCQLRGVLQKDVPLWIAKMIDRGLVDDHILNRFPIELSGGMVRRLAIAISMCGDDPFLILDEPSAGLDPRTKSDLWKSIKKYQNEGDRCVLLSTHSTQEAEALSNRIGIMKNGHLIALGTNSELKLRYGNKIQNNDIEKLIENFTQKVTKLDKNLFLKRTTQSPRDLGKKVHLHLQYEIQKDAMVLSKLISHLENFCKANDVSEWGLSETTFDNIFHNVLDRFD